MQPAERKEIISAMQYEFKTFKEDKIEPLVDTVKEVGHRVIKHGEKIAANSTKIGEVEKQTDDNKRHIFKIACIIIVGLISIVVAVLGYMWS